MVKLSRKYKKKRISKKNNRKQTKKLKSRKIKNQRGGVWETWQVRLTDYMIDNFDGSFGLDFDCCPCVFKLLLIDETDDTINNEQIKAEIAKLFEQDFTHRGMSVFEIIAFYKKIYPADDFMFDKIIKPYNLVDWDKRIFGDITPGFATLGGFERKNGSKHCIVFAKGLSGQIFLFDPQESHYREGKDPILDYLVENDVDYIYKLKVNKYHAFPPKQSLFPLKQSPFPPKQSPPKSHKKGKKGKKRKKRKPRSRRYK